MNECIIVFALLCLLIATDPAPDTSDFPRLHARTNPLGKLKSQGPKENRR
jgi:hypothetical protein